MRRYTSGVATAPRRARSPTRPRPCRTARNRRVGWWILQVEHRRFGQTLREERPRPGERAARHCARPARHRDRCPRRWSRGGSGRRRSRAPARRTAAATPPTVRPGPKLVGRQVRSALIEPPHVVVSGVRAAEGDVEVVVGRVVDRQAGDRRRGGQPGVDEQRSRGWSTCRCSGWRGDAACDRSGTRPAGRDVEPVLGDPHHVDDERSVGRAVAACAAFGTRLLGSTRQVRRPSRT